MPIINIHTITPVHIGSGVKIFNKLDFFEDENNKAIYIADFKKIFQIIGTKNIHIWTEAIEKNFDLMPILKAIKPDVIAKDIALRSIPLLKPKALKQQEVLLQILSGNGKALMPGSSIKGAIRTAIMCEIIWEDPIFSDVKKIFQLNFNHKTQKKELLLNDKNLLEKAFGETQLNLMKFLRVGDALFNSTTICEVLIANKKGDEWQFNVKGKPNTIQQVECINANQSATCKIQWPSEIELLKHTEKQNDLSTKIKQKYPIQHLKYLGPLLFKVLNNHTLRLIENEINLINQFDDTILEPYYKKLNSLHETIKNAGENECFLRLGFATGYLNMTGDWLEEDFVHKEIKNVIRKKLKAIKNEIYPKTRRFLADGTPLGYIKLSLAK